MNVHSSLSAVFFLSWHVLRQTQRVGTCGNEGWCGAQGGWVGGWVRMVQVDPSQRLFWQFCHMLFEGCITALAGPLAADQKKHACVPFSFALFASGQAASDVGQPCLVCSLLCMDGIAPLPYRQWVVPSGTHRALAGTAGVLAHLPSSADGALVRFL